MVLTINGNRGLALYKVRARYRVGFLAFVVKRMG